MPKIALILTYESSSLPFEGMGFSTNYNPRLMKNLESPKKHPWEFHMLDIFLKIQFCWSPIPSMRCVTRHDLRSSPPPLFDLVRKVPEITVEVP